MRNLNAERPLRPTQYAEKFLITAILDGTYPIGAALPSERSLAEQLGITRPTLRETLQRLAGEGWIAIRHGKPTVVKDYWREGGLSLLGTLAKHGNYLPKGFITHLLEVRLTMLPPVAGRAARYHPDILLDYLSAAANLPEDAEVFSDFDWSLQMLMAWNSRNPLFSLILNDFASVFDAIALRYFGLEVARRASRSYYQKLSLAIRRRDHKIVEHVVRAAMEESIAIWQEIRSSAGWTG